MENCVKFETIAPDASKKLKGQICESKIIFMQNLLLKTKLLQFITQTLQNENDEGSQRTPTPRPASSYNTEQSLRNVRGERCVSRDVVNERPVDGI